MPTSQYIGRFAPSPTGSAHFGTLITAVGSYLQAKKNNGLWIIRMEDVDLTRKVKGSDRDILNTLEAFGFEWDGEVLYQSERNKHYQFALDKLIEQSLIFPCLCSRKQLTNVTGDVYPGTCRHRTLPELKEHALRLLTTDTTITFDDKVMGKQTQDIKTQCGDFIIKRRDNLFAYQLAVVVDDAAQNINEVVRGADLLDNTPRQIYLQRLLNLPTPSYCHLPLVVDSDGKKTSKSEGANKVCSSQKEQLLIKTLKFLGQQPPHDLIQSDINDIWSWAIANWQLKNIPTKQKIALKQ